MSPVGRVQSKDHNLDPAILELTDGENPIQYLDMDTPNTALGIISWIDDPKRLAGCRLANQQFLDPPLKPITAALDKQQRALEDNELLPIYHEPVHARASVGGDDEREPAPDDKLMGPAVRAHRLRKAQSQTALERMRTSHKNPTRLLQNLQHRAATPDPDYNTTKSWSSIGATEPNS